RSVAEIIAGRDREVARVGSGYLGRAAERERRVARVDDREPVNRSGLSGRLGPEGEAGRARDPWRAERPRRPDVAVVAPPADHGGVAVGGQRHAKAELAGAGLVVAGEFWALLGPGAAGAGERPRRPRGAAVVPPADQGGVAVGGQ